MDDSSDGSGEEDPSRAAAARSLLGRIGHDAEPAPPDSTRGRFWEAVCRFSHYFYVLLMVVTALLVMNVLVLALIPGASLESNVLRGSPSSSA